MINSIDGPPTLLRNVSDDRHHWVGLKLIGGPKVPRDAIGATVYLTHDGIRQRGDVLSSGSYISANDQRLHFGLGDSTTVETVEIRWPDGTKETIKLPGVDRIFSVEQGKGAVAEIGGNIRVDKTAKGARPEPDTHRK